VLIRDTARRLARYEWVERRLFEILGRWSLDANPAELARLLAVQSHHHAWHAALWAERRPVLHDLTEADVAVAPALQEALEALAGSVAASERLSAVAEEVLPALLLVHRAHAAAADPVADGPVQRALGLVIADEDDDWRAARALLAAVAPGGAGAERGATRQSTLAELLAEP
jgi:hypothetical protein